MSNFEFVVGTTPTIPYSFKKVSPADLTIAVMTVKKSGRVILEKDLTEATVTEDGISWLLSQAETLDIGPGDAEFMLNWVDNNGVRGTGKPMVVTFKKNHINEVLS